MRRFLASLVALALLFGTSQAGFLINSYSVTPGNAFPAIETTAQGNTAASTSHTVTLPTGIVSGNLVLIFFSHIDATAQGNPTTWPAGWTELSDDENSVASNKPVLSIGYRFCDGSEGASITVTTADNLRAAYIGFRISGNHASTAPEKGTVSIDSASNTTSDPPSLTPSWGAKDTLWFAASAVQANTASPTFPTNYTYSSLDEDTGLIAATRAALGVGARQLNATSDDPGTFTWTNATPDTSQTVAVTPP